LRDDLERYRPRYVSQDSGTPARSLAVRIEIAIYGRGPAGAPLFEGHVNSGLPISLSACGPRAGECSESTRTQ
jgi:hypothetical protein